MIITTLLVFLEIIRLSHERHDVINRSFDFIFIVRCHATSTIMNRTKKNVQYINNQNVDMHLRIQCAPR